MKKTSGKFPFVSCATQVLLAVITLYLPSVGNCDSGNGGFRGLFEFKGKDMKEVATKVAELPEQYPMNVKGLDFSRDGNQLAVVSTEESINIWDWQSGRIAHTVKRASGASDGQTTEPIRYSPDGRLLVACHDQASDHTSDHIVARVWNTETWAIAHDIIDTYGICSAIGFTPNGKFLISLIDRLTTNPGNNLIIYNTDTWQPSWGLRTIPYHPKALAISPDGKFVAIGGGW